MFRQKMDKVVLSFNGSFTKNKKKKEKKSKTVLKFELKCSFWSNEEQ